jgi:hypothetical protein
MTMILFLPIVKKPRHAELVSASIGPQKPEPCVAGWTLEQVQGEGDGRGQGDPISNQASPQWLKAKARREIKPLRILALDKIDFPLTVPALQLLFACDGSFHVSEKLVANQNVNGMATGESRHRVRAMLVQSGKKSRRYADVQRAVGLAGQNINARLLVDHRAELGPRWMLKQVQHDEIKAWL